MSSNRKRPSRLGRGLSSLMATPTDLKPVPVEAEAESEAENASQAPPKKTGPPNEPAKPQSANTADKASGAEQSQVESDSGHASGLMRLSLDSIQRNEKQPRETFKPGALDALAKSIREQGVMQPIVVRPLADSATPSETSYEIVAGERRWRAAKLAELKAIPAVVQELTDEQCAEWALVENLQREDLNPIEKAMAFKRLSDEFGLTQAKIAERMGLERSTVTNHLRLLDLSDFVVDLLKRDMLSMGQARAIAGLPDPAQQRALAEKTVREQLSVRKVEEEVRRLLNPQPAASKTAARENHLADLEKQLAQQLGTKVKLKPGRKKGTGTLNIEFYSLEQFDALLTRMQVDTD